MELHYSKVGFSDISPKVTFCYFSPAVTNIRRRGEIGGSAKKVGKRIKELERLYGIQHGATSFQGNQYEVVPNNSETPKKSQTDLAAQMGISVDTLQNYKMLAEFFGILLNIRKSNAKILHLIQYDLQNNGYEKNTYPQNLSMSRIIRLKLTL